MRISGYLSQRLADRLRSDLFPAEAIDRLNCADFSSGRAGRSRAWESHNERIHVGIVMLTEQDGFDAALGLASLDWRDLLVAAELADEDWRVQIEVWFKS